MPLPPNHARHAALFHPHMLREHNRVEQEQVRFVHYCSADTAYNIMTGTAVWMRQTTFMNDTREIAHGLDCLRIAYHGEHGNRLKAVLNKVYPGINEEIMADFNRGIPTLQFTTYVFCLSEHGGEGPLTPTRDLHEDRFGRLSMWRAYGRGAGVALVINSAPLIGPSTAMGAYTSPVAYMEHSEVGRELGTIATGLEQNLEYLESLQRDGTKRAVLAAFQFAAVCTKHPGFREEREWRVVAMPYINDPKRLTPLIKTIDGVPQKLFSIKLEDVPDEGLVGLTPPALIDRVIIGPTEQPAAVYGLFYDTMKSIGISDVDKKIWASHVPLRVTRLAN